MNVKQKKKRRVKKIDKSKSMNVFLSAVQKIFTFMCAVSSWLSQSTHFLCGVGNVWVSPHSFSLFFFLFSQYYLLIIICVWTYYLLLNTASNSSLCIVVAVSGLWDCVRMENEKRIFNSPKYDDEEQQTYANINIAKNWS